MELSPVNAALLQKVNQAAPQLDPSGTDALIAILKTDDRFFSEELLALHQALRIQQEDSSDENLKMSLGRIMYCRFYAARRLKEYSVMKQLSREMRHFVDDSKFATFYVMIGEAAALDAVNEREIAEVVSQAEFAVQVCQLVAGAHNFLAECLVNWALVTSNVEKRRERLSRANDAIKMAQTLKRDYAKFVALEARIAALQGAFQYAKQRITDAIEMESPAQPDYTIRLGDFAAIRSEIGFLEQNALLFERQEEAIAEMNSVRSDSMQLLGVLAAVIAFLVTGVNIAQEVQLPVRDFARIMVMLTGLNVTVFSTFSIGVGRPRNRGSLAMLGLGLTLLLAPLLYFPEVV